MTVRAIDAAGPPQLGRSAETQESGSWLGRRVKRQAVRDVACGAEPLRRIIKDEHGVRVGELLDDLEAEFGSGIETQWQRDKLSVQLFLEDLRKEWGPGRVQRALERCSSQLEYRACEGLPLLAGDVNQLVHDLADPHQEDLDEFWSLLQRICAHPEWQGSSLLSLRQQRALQPLSLASDGDLYATVRRVFAPTIHLTASELAPELFDVLSRGVHCTHEEIDSMLQGRRIPGVITGYPLGGLSTYLVYSRDYELRERLQLYEQLTQQPVSDEAFDELLAKALVKKRLTQGMLIPRKIAVEEAGSRTVYYRVESVVRSGFGKLAYHLVPANETDHELDDLLVYRSTTSSPAMEEPVETLLQDFYPDKPPGYKWNEYGQAAEREVFFGRGQSSTRCLRVIGHSLGGSHAQLSLAARTLGTHGALAGLPARPIKLVTFDAPALDKQDAAAFSTWARSSQQAGAIEITHYFSDWDPVPGAGDKHLGYGCEEGTAVTVASYVFSKLNAKHPRLDFHPHGRHWLWTKAGMDHLRKRVKLIDYDNARWRGVVELGRKVVGKALFKPALRLLQQWRAIMA